ncbi:MAG: phenylalanine--tRNA ligase subunit alpha [Candidatus Thermoplasmatota archaeon]|nr:phenylalanine--tRNA ligase subunit alpha [Candidatus Thermoplasmatota archaeon]
MTQPDISADLSNNEYMLLRYLSVNGNGSFVSEDQINITEMDARAISSAVSWLEKKGMIEVASTESRNYALGQEGIEYLNNGLPEERVYKYLLENGSSSIQAISDSLSEQITRVGVTQLAKLGFRPLNGVLSISEDQKGKDIFSKGRKCLEDIRDGLQPDAECIQYFRKRGTVIIERKVNTRKVKINLNGLKYLSREEVPAVGQLTPQMLSGEAWKGIRFRRYDLNLSGESSKGAFLHPLTYLRNEVAQIFLQMGFSEMRGHFIEYSGWNMDALFIPQDHPAREMQDTFYLNSEVSVPYDHEDLIKRVGKVHESGIGEYTGWGYRWDPEISKKLLLRTHTTVSTVRSLYEIQKAPAAFFSIDRVFRHESVDWKHLAELHQIEGTYYADDANLSTLKWLMEEFYRRLGFDRIKLVPSYYPYTEPSMDVIVQINGKEVELGGSGVFRPEVMKPLGLESQAIAWGLGLERLAMIYYELADIRGIYQSDIDWLQSYRLRL